MRLPDEMVRALDAACGARCTVYGCTFCDRKRDALEAAIAAALREAIEEAAHVADWNGAYFTAMAIRDISARRGPRCSCGALELPAHMPWRMDDGYLHGRGACDTHRSAHGCEKDACPKCAPSAPPTTPAPTPTNSNEEG